MLTHIPDLVVVGLGVGNTNPVLSFNVVLISLTIVFSLVVWGTLSFTIGGGNMEESTSEFCCLFESVETVVFKIISAGLGGSNVCGVTGLEMTWGFVTATGVEAERSGGSFGKSVGTGFGLDLGVGVITAVGGFFIGGGGNGLGTAGGEDFTGCVESLGGGVFTTGPKMNINIMY